MPRKMEESCDHPELGKRIQHLRSGKGWSLLEAAHQVGLSPSYLSELEGGCRNPRLDTLQKLAAGFDTSISMLVDGAVGSLPPELVEVAEHWPALSDEKRTLVVELVRHLGS